MDLQSLIEGWDGLAAVARFDRPTGTWIFVALHDATLGPPTGGTRLRSYDTPAAGLHDAMHLAEGMTHKWAAAGLPYGGGKAVLAVPGPLEGAEREGLLLRFGGLVESLHGSFLTSEDLGTSPQDMLVMGRATRYMMGNASSGASPVDPGPFTARGVCAAMRAALRRTFGSDDLRGRTVLIQGVGDVGGPLTRLLVKAGARLLLSDTNSARLESLVAEVGGDGEVATVAPDAVYDTPCDVYAPCAVGFTLSEETIPRLRCRVVTGSANNQLATPEAADLLHRRGILYSPDYVANGGGAIAFGLMHQGEQDAQVLWDKVDLIGETVEEIFAEAAARDESPLAAARRRVEGMLKR